MSVREPTKEMMVRALREVREPTSGKDVVMLALLRSVAYCDGVARVGYELPSQLAAPPIQASLRQQSEAALRSVPGIREVNVEIAVSAGAASAPGIPGVKHVIAVGAGKGGVGKSTVAVLLAVGLRRRGFRVGLLDADVYGPSVPKLTGTEGAQPHPDAEGRIVPPEMDGVRILSMGYLVGADQAIVWRGPMAQKYVKEFLERGAWGELDYLIVDLPPGTGDVPLTLSQSIPLTGAVIVCTPQDVALLDAVKALRMYQKLNVDVLGMVENMSYYLCPHCGQRDEIFSHGGAAEAARQLHVPFLGEIPLNIAIRQSGDTGTPAENFAKRAGKVAEALESLTSRLVEEVERRTAERAPTPQLRIT